MQYFQRLSEITNKAPFIKPFQHEEDMVSNIFIQPNVMNEVQQKKCMSILSENSEVFDNDVSQGYNNFSGELDVNWNWLNNQLPPPNI